MRGRILLLGLMGAVVMLLGGCGEMTCKHSYQTEAHTEATCVEKGTTTYVCEVCGETYIEEEEIDDTAHWSSSMKTLVEPTLTEPGKGEAVCEICGATYEQEISELGDRQSAPYVVDSSTLWKAVKSKGGEDYVRKYIQVTGKVKRVSAFSDMCGYYLEGKEKGSGVVCWVNESSQSLQKGEKATFLGYVAVDNGTTSIEITDCTVLK